MGEPARPPIQVTCPRCRAELKVDPVTGIVLSHAEAPKSAADLQEALKALKGEADKREAAFKASMEAEKEKGKVLEKKFKEALKKAKDEPVTPPPTRDIDLD